VRLSFTTVWNLGSLWWLALVLDQNVNPSTTLVFHIFPDEKRDNEFINGKSLLCSSAHTFPFFESVFISP
jgi:hypothetical protein